MNQMKDENYPRGTIVILPEGEHMRNVPDHKEWVVVAHNRGPALHFFTPTNLYRQNAHFTTQELLSMDMEERQEKGIYRLANYRFLVKGMVDSTNIAHKARLYIMED